MDQSQTQMGFLEFLEIAANLKSTKRTGWLRTVPMPESVADHSYRVALLGLFAPEGLDVGKCIVLGLCHDMAEATIGDIPTYAGVDKDSKRKLEANGIEYIVSLLRIDYPDVGQKIEDAWFEYERGVTREARYVREADKLECLAQAFTYEQETHGKKDLSEFQGLRSKIQSVRGVTWVDALSRKREDYFTKQKSQTPVIFVRNDSNGINRTPCESVAKELGFQLVVFDDVLEEKSNDLTHDHQAYIKRSIEQGIEIPAELAVNLLSEEIDNAKKNGMTGTLVCGFPETTPYRIGFQEKIQNTNFTLFLRNSPGGSLQLSTEANPPTTKRKSRYFEDIHTKTNTSPDTAVKYSTEVNGDGPVEEVKGRMREAIQGLVQHAAKANVWIGGHK